MTMNVKTYEKAHDCLATLESQLKVESKADPRLVRGCKRITRMLKLLKTAQDKYELVHSRKVPAKVAARKAKGKAKTGGRRRTPAKKRGGNVVKLHPRPAAKAA